jgi:indole-3-glycerol phosphate synthase
MNILETITGEKRHEVEHLRSQAGRIKQIAASRRDFRDFAAALRGGSSSVTTDDSSRGADGAAPSKGSKGVTLIAEIKKASPSGGVICTDFDPLRIARAYEQAGASALSVLTDEKFFQGRLDHLQMIRAEVKLPLLRKDFIIDELQVYESVAYGADAILLIVAILDAAQLKAFSALAKSLRVAALVEVHHERELDRALAAGAEIIGINNRNLRDFSVSLETTERLASIIFSRGSDIPVATGRGKNAAPTTTGMPIVVAESGIHTRADVERVRKAGVDAILVGESLMKSGDIAAKVRELMG